MARSSMNLLSRAEHSSLYALTICTGASMVFRFGKCWLLVSATADIDNAAQVIILFDQF